MSIATIPQIIVRGDISTYLAANDNSKGALYGRRIAAPISPITIALITDALRWGYDGGAQTDQSLREVGNYVVWLTGKYGQEAQAISEGQGGGSVIPGGGSGIAIFPIRVTGANFESDGVSLNDPRLVGVNLTLFVDQYANNNLFSPDFFVYTATGIQIIADGFNANDFPEILINRYSTL